MVYLVFLFILTAVAAALVLATFYLMARQLLSPPRMSDGKAMFVLKRLSPEDLGLKYEEISFNVDDLQPSSKLKMAAWWIPAATRSNRTVMLIHGYGDAKVGGIAWAPVWHQMGWNVLAVDLRAHGESQGKFSTGGFYERHDVDQIINSIRQTHPRATTDFALFGVSLGAAVVSAVAAGRDDLAAVVLDSPFPDYRNAVIAHARRLAMPIEWGYCIVTRWAEWISGARFDQVRPIDFIPRIAAPLLVLHGDADSLVTREQMDQFKTAITSRTSIAVAQHILVENAQHTRAVATDPLGYQRHLQDFFNQIASNSPATTTDQQPAQAE